MNILYMHTHDTGTYIEPYGHHADTPHLTELAKEGIVFRNAFSAAPTCSPSRAALLTGMWPHSAGMLGLAHRGFKLEDNSRHLAHFLKGHGFDTVLCGLQHEAGDADAIGYGQVLHDHVKEDEDNAAKVADFLLKRKSDKPFFLSFGMESTHREFPEIDPDIDPDYVLPPFPMADSKENRTDMAGFLTSVRRADRCAGIVLKALRESGLDQSTLVIFTTDHGIAFPRMKCSLYDTGIRVSLILRIPGLERLQKVVDGLVSQIDLFPTLCELLDIPRPEWLQGRSLLPLLTGETDEIREELFAEVTYHAAYEPKRAVRTSRYKLIRLFEDDLSPVPANIDDGPGKQYVLERGILEEVRDREYLFDLALDPTERVNRIHDENFRSIREALSARLDRWMAETGDPLLQGGKVPKPAGAIANKRSCLSAETDDFEL